jgi:S1-C subfamily serine protease
MVDVFFGGLERRDPVSIPEQFTYRPAAEGSYRPAAGEWAPTDGTYAPPPGGWPPAEGWTQYYQPPPPPPRRRHNGRVIAGVAGGVAALLIAAGGGFAAGWSLHPSASASSYLPLAPTSGNGAQSGGSGAQPGGLGSGSGNSGGGTGTGGTGTGATGSGAAGGATAAQVASVASKVDPALVDIDTVLGAENGEAAGTGIVIGSDGIILTNNHVVAGATSITVTDLGNQKSYRAAVVGYDRNDDIAVVQLSGASGLATATLSTAAVKAGDAVVAIGNAGGTGGTPSAVGGAISALNQSITASDESSGSSEQLTGLIEVNADIEAGDSGGPLLTTSGQVIGVDTAASAGFQYQSAGGDGFAIPIANATTIADQIRGGQSSSKVHIGDTAYLGIEVASGSLGGQGAAGPVVRGVIADSPADGAGLARGDVIRSVAGTTVSTATALTDVLDRHHPGDKVKVAWTDASGQSQSSTLKLTTGPVG